MDFSLILVIATAISGLLTLFGLALSRGDGMRHVTESVWYEYSRSFFPILLLVLIVRSFLFEPFRIPSSSMMPTLLIGDFIFVNKYTYGLRLPVTNTKVVTMGEPSRGDVVVFKLPSAPGTNYIKRLVGLPGDVITYKNKRLFVNGEAAPTTVNGDWTEGGAPNTMLGTETLGDITHNVLYSTMMASNEGQFVVPDGHYFMMGDNRDNSRDSRYPGVGFIPENRLVGKAVRIWMNWDFESFPRWKRIGQRII